MSDDDIKHFLVTFDIRRDASEVEEFGTDTDAALAAYFAAEQAHSGDRNIEVVLLGSDSLETVKRTHANYFGLGDWHVDHMVEQLIAERDAKLAS